VDRRLRDAFAGTRRAIEVQLRETETRIDDAQLRGHDGPEASEELADLIAIRDAARKCLERIDADDHAGFMTALVKLARRRHWMGNRRKGRTKMRIGRIGHVGGKRVVDATTAEILDDHDLSRDAVFCGECMTCAICGVVEQSDPRVSSQWRAIVFKGELYYFCPAEFPPDGSGSHLFKLAYQRVLAAAALRARGEPLDDDVFRPVRWLDED